jgi:hypothetical protein
VATLRFHTRDPRWLLFVEVLVAVEDIIWSLVLNTYVMEWMTIGLFLGYILFIGLETKRNPPKNSQTNVREA